MCVRPRASVVIPAHNVVQYIRPAVESALNQSVEDIEVIVVDDGSMDGTITKLSDVCDKRFRLVRQQHQGAAAARNTGVSLCRAQFVGFLDGDDLWLPEKLQKHITFLEAHPEIDLTFSLARILSASGEITLTIPSHGGIVEFRDFLVENLARCSSTVVLRREALARAGPFDLNLDVCQDHDMWLRIARLRPGNVYGIPEPLTLYRRRQGQLTAQWRLVHADWQRVLEKMRRIAAEDVAASEAKASSQMYHYFAYLAYEQGEPREAFRLLRRSFRQSPTMCLKRTRSWLLAAACLSGMLLPDNVHCMLERWALRADERSGTPTSILSGRW